MYCNTSTVVVVVGYTSTTHNDPRGDDGISSVTGTAVMGNHSLGPVKPPPPSLERIVLSPLEMVTSDNLEAAVQREVDRRNHYVKQKLKETLGPRKARWR